MLRQRLPKAVFCHTHRLIDVANGILHHHFVLAFAEQNADGWVIRGVAQLVIHNGKIKVELASILWLERRGFQLHYNIAPEM